MNDPHVESLTYRVTKADTVDFDKAPPRTVDKGAFRVTLDAYTATVTMIDHFATAAEARGAVEPFLRAWELSTDVDQPEEHFRFVFGGAHVVDRGPAPAGATVVPLGIGAIANVGANLTVYVRRHRWPDPPEGLALSPEVEIMRRCWLAYRRGEWPMAATYLALTVLEATAQLARGGPARPAACAYYNVSRPVLNTYAELTSTRGGDEARKAEGLHAPLSPEERTWIEAAFKALVLRAAERAYYGGPPPRQLTMADLPNLPKP